MKISLYLSSSPPHALLLFFTKRQCQHWCSQVITPSCYVRQPTILVSSTVPFQSFFHLYPQTSSLSLATQALIPSPPGYLGQSIQIKFTTSSTAQPSPNLLPNPAALNSSSLRQIPPFRHWALKPAGRFRAFTLTSPSGLGLFSQTFTQLIPSDPQGLTQTPFSTGIPPLATLAKEPSSQITLYLKPSFIFFMEFCTIWY